MRDNEKKGEPKRAKPAGKSFAPPAQPVAAAPVMKVRAASAPTPPAEVVPPFVAPPVADETPVVATEAPGATDQMTAVVPEISLASVEVVPAVAETAPSAAGADVPAPADAVAAADVEPVVLVSAESVSISSDRPTPASTSVSPPFSKGIFDMASTFTAPTTPAAVAEKVQAAFGGINEQAKSAMEKSAKFGEELKELTKGNVEALVASGTIIAKGAESLTQEVVEYSKKNFESTTAMFKSVAAVKSPTELFQLQSQFAKSSFDSAVAEASKLSEAFVKLAGEVAQPISNRYAVAAEKLKVSAL